MGQEHLAGECLLPVLQGYLLFHSILFPYGQVSTVIRLLFGVRKGYTPANNILMLRNNVSTVALIL